MNHVTPGIYVEEIVATGPIAGVGTSVAAFLGPAGQGPLETPTLVANWTDFQNSFGDDSSDPDWPYYLGASVRGFFENGGSVAYVTRVGSALRATLTLQDRNTPPSPVLDAIARRPGEAGNDIQVKVDDDANGAFKLTVTRGQTSETHPSLSLDPQSPRYCLTVVNAASSMIRLRLRRDAARTAGDKDRPAVLAATNLTGGLDLEAAAAPGLAARYQNALAALEAVDEVNLVCVPGQTTPAVQQAVLDHCTRMADRFAILDGPAGDKDDAVLTLRAAADSPRGFGAMYYPWLMVQSPRSDAPIPIPPSGHIAGIYGRSDSERGVQKAPANEVVQGALGLARPITDTLQGIFNEAGINCLRVFPGRSRPVVWGARTTAPKEATAWRYVSVRRLFLYIEESIQEGIRWAVFEPNDFSLWKKLERTLTEFLGRMWRDGALVGATAAQAFYVKIDEELNPPAVRALGQVNIEIGVAPVRPAEFVVVRIGMWEGGASLNEG